jgi:hypothetical protein
MLCFFSLPDVKNGMTYLIPTHHPISDNTDPYDRIQQLAFKSKSMGL